MEENNIEAPRVLTPEEIAAEIEKALSAMPETEPEPAVLGARCLLKVKSELDLLERHGQQLHYSDAVKAWKRTAAAHAHVSDGRWIVDCACGCEVLAEPGWRLAACFECGCVMANVVFPAEPAAVVDELKKRPKNDRVWKDGVFGREKMVALGDELLPEAVASERIREVIGEVVEVIVEEVVSENVEKVIS